MQLAVLFWFYKEPEICKNHLEVLRLHNPDIPIYGLYGGELEDVESNTITLNEYFDDLYIYPKAKSPQWKWHLGDLLITDWYTHRGQDLVWDTIVIVQWDMLVTGPIYELFSMLKKDQILLSGLRPIDKEFENSWRWTSPNSSSKLRQQYLGFLDFIKEEYSFDREPLGCIFIVVCFPRAFLHKYSEIEHPELGFLEYRVPIYAQIFGTPFCINHPFKVIWDDEPLLSKKQMTITAEKLDIGLITILKNITDRNGLSVFHPYRKRFPLNKKQWLLMFPMLLWQDCLEQLSKIAKKVKYS